MPPKQSGEVDVLPAFQMQHLSDFRGRSNLDGEFVENVTNLPELLGVTRCLDAGAKIDVVFKSNANVCAENRSRGQKGQLVASRAQYRKLIAVSSK